LAFRAQALGDKHQQLLLFTWGQLTRCCFDLDECAHVSILSLGTFPGNSSGADPLTRPHLQPCEERDGQELNCYHPDMAKLGVQEIRNLAKQIIAANPGGIWYSQLVAQIAAPNPSPLAKRWPIDSSRPRPTSQCHLP